jgi:hypothetical protein
MSGHNFGLTGNARQDQQARQEKRIFAINLPRQPHFIPEEGRLSAERSPS